jgi:SAM-dependent methyltransferase
MENPLETALERELAAFLKEEYASQREELYQWYRLKFVPHDIGLAPYDIAIADFVTEHCASFGRFVEIGAGIGQQSMLLAVRRYRTWAVEATDHMTALAERAFARVKDRVYPDLPNYMSMVKDIFPNRAQEYVTSDSVLCFPSLSWGLTPEEEVRVLNTIGMAGGVILTLRSFFKARETTEERDILIDQIRQQGFGAPVDVYMRTQMEYSFYPDRIVFMKKSN